jgi:predicted naringenin-chalcone synthase
MQSTLNKVAPTFTQLSAARLPASRRRRHGERHVSHPIEKIAELKPYAQARFRGLGVANPLNRFSQEEIPQQMGIADQRLKRFFEHEHIKYRHLYLPSGHQFAQTVGSEKFSDLLQRFVDGATEISQSAMHEALAHAGLGVQDIDFICCVTSTGFVVPTLSARFIKEFGLRNDCQRSDIVGMGCSAGLNGLSTVTNWCNANPGKNGLLICVEICSAIYAVDNTQRTAIVNSLFGDGAAAAVLRAERNDSEFAGQQPRVVDFESHLIPEHSEILRFDWDEEKGCFSFLVGRATPEVMAACVDQPLKRLLDKHGLVQSDIKHWIFHGGGDAVITGMRIKLGLDDRELRHTRTILRDFGNLSSGSFLFSFKRLAEEDCARTGDYGVMITMGPGLAIEMALIQW